jgi:hypothetical protein
MSERTIDNTVTAISPTEVLAKQGLVTLGILAGLVISGVFSVELLVVLSYLGFLLLVQLTVGAVPVVDLPIWLQVTLVVATFVVFGILFGHVFRIWFG